MKRTIEALPPETVVDCYLKYKGHGQVESMWAELGDATIQRLVDGAVTLATIWESAWIEGGGDSGSRFKSADLKKVVPKKTLIKLYNDRAFVESKWLKNM
jgi:hypothetical protein